MAKQVSIKVVLENLFSPHAKNIENSVKTLRQRFKRFERSLYATARAMKDLGKEMLKIGTVISAGFLFPVKAAADFEKEMANVAAISMASREELEKLSEAAREVGRTTKFSAIEAAKGLQVLVRAGVSVEDSIKALPSILNLAAASNESFALSASAVIEVTKQFGLSMDQASHVVDVLTYAVNNSNQILPDLQIALAGVGSIARSLGVSLEQTVGFFALLANAGVKGSRASTVLKNTLLRLVGQSGEGKKAIEDLGLAVKDVQGNFIALSDIIKQVKDKLKGFGTADVGRIIAQIFRRRALAGFPAILAQSADSLDNFTESLKNAGGTAQKATTRQLDNLWGSVSLLKAAFTSFLIEVGEPFLKFLQDFVLAVREVILSIEKWIQENKKISTVFTKWIGLVGGIIVALGALQFALGTLILAFKALKTVMLAIGIGRIIAALIIFKLLIEGFVDSIKEFGNDIKRFFRILELELLILLAKIQKNVIKFAHIATFSLSESVQDEISLLEQTIEDIKQLQMSILDDMNKRKNAQKKLNKGKKEELEVTKKLKSVSKSINSILNSNVKEQAIAAKKLELYIEKLKTRLQSLEISVRRGLDKGIEIYLTKRKIIEAETEAKLRALDKEIKAAPERKDILEQERKIVLQKQIRALKRLDAEWQQYQDKIQKRREDLENIILALQIKNIKDKEKRELLELNIVHDKNLANIDKLAQEAELSEEEKTKLIVKAIKEQEKEIDAVKERYRKEREEKEKRALEERKKRELAAIRDIQRTRERINKIFTDAQSRLYEAQAKTIEEVHQKELFDIDALHAKKITKLNEYLEKVNEIERASKIAQLAEIQELERQAILERQKFEREQQKRELKADFLQTLAEGAPVGFLGLGELEAEQAAELTSLQAQFAEELHAFAQKEEDKTKIEKFAQAQREALRKRALDHEIARFELIGQYAADVTSGISEMFANMYELTGKQQREFLMASKAAAIAEIIINTAIAAMKAYAEGGPYAGPILAALVTAVGASKVALIAAQSFAQGGLVLGGSSEGKDDVPALLGRNEYVVSAAPVRKYGVGFLEAVNRQLLPRDAVAALMSGIASSLVPRRPAFAFQTGGLVSTPTPRFQEETQPPRTTIINVDSPDRIYDAMQEAQGENIIINSIRARRMEIKEILSE